MEIGISNRTQSALKDMKFNELTEVQNKIIPLIIKGREVICRSKTGTGKTAAFGIGMIELIVNKKINKGLVITPTRELALQVAKELSQIGKYHNIWLVTVYGGVSISRQQEQLKRGVDIVVATPGRLIDLINRGYLDPQNFNMVVLDEADVMLDMGFIDDIDRILRKINNPTVLLFSATVDKKIFDIANRYMENYEYVEMSDLSKPVEIIEKIIDVNRKEKFGALLDILYHNKQKRILIFVNTKRMADILADKLYDKRFKVDSLHGDMSQHQREIVMSKFKQGRLPILVATDVAARGIHVDNVDIVINYDLAKTAKIHLHRIGRTGRMNRRGIAISFNVTGGMRRHGEGYLPRTNNRKEYVYNPRR